MKKFLLIMLLLFTVVSCAEAVPVAECVGEDPYGFFGGIWHGMILPFSFIGSLFSDSIVIYAVDNSGGWYDFGFLIGLGGSYSYTSR